MQALQTLTLITGERTFRTWNELHMYETRCSDNIVHSLSV